jgi:folylpolyglutamate synthase/dihydropteroate synthase
VFAIKQAPTARLALQRAAAEVGAVPATTLVKASATRRFGPNNGALLQLPPPGGGHATQHMNASLFYPLWGVPPAANELKMFGASLRAQTRLLGVHQADNARTALTVIGALCASAPTAARRAAAGDAPWRVSREALQAGLEAAALPGRFSVAWPAAAGARLVADGAHTLAAATALAATLATPPLADAPLALVLALASDKDLARVFRPLARTRPRAVFLTAVPIAGSAARAAAPERLAAAWADAWAAESAGNAHNAATAAPAVVISPGLAAAVASAARAVGAGGTVCVAGSLHGAWGAQRALRRHGASLLACDDAKDAHAFTDVDDDDDDDTAAV